MAKTTLSDIRLLVRENRQESHACPSAGTGHSLGVQAEPDSGLLPPSVFSPDTASHGQLLQEYTETLPLESIDTSSHPKGISPGCIQTPAPDSTGISYCPGRILPGHIRSLPRTSTISSETKQALMAVEGIYTIRELSDRYGIPAQALYRWARKNHYQYKSGLPHFPLPAKTEQKIVADLSIMSTAQLSKAYGIPYHILYHWMKKRGLTAKKTSEFPEKSRKELLKKCRTDSLETLAQEYCLSRQVMRSRLQSMGCFSDGKGGFLIVEGHMDQEILACCMEKGLAETAKEFHTTKTAVKSFLKRCRNMNAVLV